MGAFLLRYPSKASGTPLDCIADVATALFVVFVVVLAFSMTTAEERTRFCRRIFASGRQVTAAAAAHHAAATATPFHDALRERTRWAIATPALLALNALIFVRMLFDSGALSDPETLVAWGGNIGPRTTNGEWWRLATAMFVHSGLLHLLTTVAGLTQVGLILERLVGRPAFVAVYIAAGVVGNILSLSAHPVAVSVGASAGICGIYGLFVASFMWSLSRRSTVTIPIVAMKPLLPSVAIFAAYNLATDSMTAPAELAGFLVGLTSGLVLTRRVTEGKPGARSVAGAMAATAMIVVISAVPLRGIADVRPEIARLLTVEDQTTRSYEQAVGRFRLGRITAGALAQTIDRGIMPELRATRDRLKMEGRIPDEQQPLLASAEAYLRLREQCWRLRSEALHKASMKKLYQADQLERASLEAIARLKPANRQ